MEISFDHELAVASIQLAGWAPELVDHVRRYFDIQEGMIRLDYAHLSGEKTNASLFWSDWTNNEREQLEFELKIAAREGPIATSLVLLGRGNSGIKNSSSILDPNTYPSAVEAFRKDVLNIESQGLRAIILDEIAPHLRWTKHLLGTGSKDRANFLKDRQLMSALVRRTSKDDCIATLKLVITENNQETWAFEQLAALHWEHVLDCLTDFFNNPSNNPHGLDRHFLCSLYANSLMIQNDRRACELVLDQDNPIVFSQLIQHCHTLTADDVRKMLLHWHSQPKTGKKDDLRERVAKACSTLAKLSNNPLPSDLALAAAWHGFVEPKRSSQQSVVESLKELPTGTWDQGSLWSQLGPAAREAWRHDLLDHVTGRHELAQGLLSFSCLWLAQEAFAEVEPVLLQLIVDHDHLTFATELARTGPRQVQLRAKGLVRQKLEVLDFEAPQGQSEDATAMPSVNAKTWLCDPSVERVIHKAVSRAEEDFCSEYSGTWGEDEEAHTARLLSLTQVAVGNASCQLHQLSSMTRSKYPSLSVAVRQPSKREEGTVTHAGAPLGADVLFLTRIMDNGKPVIQRATLVQVKKRFGTASGKGFSSKISINLGQCQDMLTQTEHAYYLIATPASTPSVLWVAPARLVRNLTQLGTSKTTVEAAQVRDASCSFADFFLYSLVGLWAGDEREEVVALAHGDPRLGRTPRYIVEIEIRRQPDD